MIRKNGHRFSDEITLTKRPPMADSGASRSSLVIVLRPTAPQHVLHRTFSQLQSH
jgi:hypothetical protein